MRLRFIRLPASLVSAALLAYCTTLLPVVAGADDSGGTAAAADTLQRRLSFPDALQSARAHYQQAWKLREAGELGQAWAAAGQCISVLELAETGAVSASDYREAAELRSKAAGLRDALAGQMEPKAKTSTPEAPDAVLDAPAIDDINVETKEEVYRWIQYFTGNGRPVFERWLRRSGIYMDMFRAILEREGLPSDLVHLVFVESGFNPQARSVSAAVGPWQFLRSTGRLFGLTVNAWVDERKDPEKSTVAAARYLKHLYSIFGDWRLALASYNAGEGTVLRAVARQGTTDFWKLRLPRQTREYVPQFMALVSIARDPQRYGFDGVELQAPMDFDEIALVGAADLRSVAKLAGCSFEELKFLNPAVLRHTATGRYGVTTLRVPRGTGEELMHKLQTGQASLPAASLSVRHRVSRGETLKKIAAQYGVSARALANANHITRRHPLRRGIQLNIPGTLKVAMRPQPVPADFIGPLPPASTVPLRAERRIPVMRVPTAMNASLEEGPLPPTTRSVRVRRGESLGSIASRQGVTVGQLKRWNHLRRSVVHPGQRLWVERPTGVVTTARAANPANRYRVATVIVRRGDTLNLIARRHGTTVAALMKANGLKSARSLRAGRRLNIPEA